VPRTAGYDYVGDLCRVQCLVRETEVTRGYAILLTNHCAYWSPGGSGTVERLPVG